MVKTWLIPDYVNPAAPTCQAHGRIQKFRKAFMSRI